MPQHGLAVWSKTASSNQTADDNAYLAEGQPASSVNNAIRGAMASAAEWRDDNLGTLSATRGTSETYAVTPSQVLPNLTSPFSLAFVVDADNQAPAKLNVGGLGAKAIKRRYGRELGPGDLTAGVIYKAVWLPASDYFLIVAPEIESPGVIKALAGATPDKGWLKCYGQAVSRTSYAALFAAIGTTWGVGDGSTTFNLPDLSGRTLFGADNMSGTAAGRLTETVGGLAGTLGSMGGAQSVTLTTTQIPAHSHIASTNTTGAHTHTVVGNTGNNSVDHVHYLSTGQLTTGQETRDHSHSFSGSGTAAEAGAHSHTVTAFNETAGGGVAGGNVYQQATLTTSTGGAHTHSVTVSGTTGGVSATHEHNFNFAGYTGGQVTSAGASQPHYHAVSLTSSESGSHSHTVTVNNAGGGAGHANIPPGAVVTFVIKV